MDIVSYTHARQNLKAVLDKVVDNSEPTVIFRPNGKHVVMLSKVDYDALDTTEYLMSDPRNAAALRESMQRLRSGDRTGFVTKTLEELKAYED